jgi:small multidrug resistance pump
MTPQISHFSSRSRLKPAPWMKWVLFVAAAYNAFWGAWVGLFPKASFDLLGMSTPAYLPLWQSVGLMVGCYAIGYFIAAFDAYQYWALILVGFIGKVLGPLGMIYAVTSRQLPLEFAWNNLTNDVIWWIPFFLILRGAYLAYLNQDISEDKTKP